MLITIERFQESKCKSIKVFTYQTESGNWEKIVVLSRFYLNCVFYQGKVVLRNLANVIPPLFSNIYASVKPDFIIQIV